MTIWRRHGESVLVMTRRKLAGLENADINSILDLVASRLELPARR